MYTEFCGHRLIIKFTIICSHNVFSNFDRIRRNHQRAASHHGCHVVGDGLSAIVALQEHAYCTKVLNSVDYKKHMEKLWFSPTVNHGFKIHCVGEALRKHVLQVHLNGQSPHSLCETTERGKDAQGTCKFRCASLSLSVVSRKE